MTVQQLRAAHQAIPFQPFNIRIADGRAFAVPHPDFLSIAPSGRIAVIFREDDYNSTVDLLLMTEIERLPVDATKNSL